MWMSRRWNNIKEREYVEIDSSHSSNSSESCFVNVLVFSEFGIILCFVFVLFVSAGSEYSPQNGQKKKLPYPRPIITTSTQCLVLLLL